MTDFFEIDDDKKTIRILNLDDLSTEDLDKYITELKLESVSLILATIGLDL